MGRAGSRTAERILEAALHLFNRFGEPNVPTAQIAAAVGISPGNLHYHFPSKDGLVNVLFARHEDTLSGLLEAAGDARDVEDAWFFLHALFEDVWRCRFVYRDINDLVTRNRALETRVAALLDRERHAIEAMLGGLREGGSVTLSAADIAPTATTMVVVLAWWLSYEFVRAPREALEEANAQSCMLRAARHVLHLLVPYLANGQRAHLLQLAQAYDSPAVAQ